MATNLLSPDSQKKPKIFVLTVTMLFLIAPLCSLINFTRASTSPLAGIGDDYLVYYNDGSPEVWDNSGILNKFETWGRTARIGFAFTTAPGTHTFSDYDQTKMDRVIEILAANDIKPILCLFNIADMAGYVGSTNFVNEWISLATHYSGDDRILAYQIFNEPTNGTWSTSGPVGNVNSVAKLHEAFNYTIGKIREVDPTRTIVYPVMYGMGLYSWTWEHPFPYTTFQNDLTTAGVIAQGNIIYDVVHPYYWEDGGMDVITDPEDMADFFGTYLLEPAVTMFGEANVWVGESFPWGVSQGPYTPSVQIAFWTQLLNVCEDNNVGLCAMAYLTTDHAWEYDDALAASYYAPTLYPIPTPTATVPGVTPTIPPTNPLSADFIIQTTQPFNINFADNEQLNIQDSQQNINVTFQVTSGAWQGTGNLNVTTSGGTFIVNPTVASSLLITSSSSDFYLTVNGIPTSNGAVTFSPGTAYLILWQYIPTTIPGPVIIGTTNSRLYFRSDQYTSNTVTANGLDITNTNSEQTITSAITTETVTYGFRVWVLHKTGSTTELTDGTPEIQLTRTANGAGWQNTTWLCPATTLSLGKDSLQVEIYLSLDSGATWTPKAIYVTNPLLSTALLHQTWTFSMYTTRNTTLATTTFTFGSRTYNSNINGVGMQSPTQTEIQSWRFLNGDYIAFIFGAYASIGPAAYLLMLLIPTGTLYVRHRNFGPVALFFILFGGPGGIVWLFVPAWAAIAVDILLILGCSFIVWRIIR